MDIGYKLYESLRDTDTQSFEKLQLEMALICVKNGWCMEDGIDEERGRYLIINPAPKPPPIDINIIKDNKIVSLKNERDLSEVKPIEYNGVLFDYDEKARERINAAIVALEVAGASASLVWTTADNKDVKVTASDLRGIIVQVALRSDKLHTAYRKAKEKVETATTKEEVEAIILNV